jgi:hypothetical protein
MPNARRPGCPQSGWLWPADLPRQRRGLGPLRGDATREQFLGIFGEGIEAVEHHKLAPLPAIEDFSGGAGWMAARAASQEDVRVQDYTKRTGIYRRSVML